MLLKNVLLMLSSTIKYNPSLKKYHVHSYDSFIKKLILSNTVLTTQHLTPEIKLQLITPECSLWHSDASVSKFPNDPFWGIYWPGGQALARCILDHKYFVEKQNVLDIGSGSGASAIAAMKSGAQLALANDIDATSIVAININSKLNNVDVCTLERNLIGEDIDNIAILVGKHEKLVTWNVILVGDMFYDSDIASSLFLWLVKLVDEGKTVLIGDPGRHGLDTIKKMSAIGRLMKIVEYKFENIEHNGFPSAAVYKVTR